MKIKNEILTDKKGFMKVWFMLLLLSFNFICLSAQTQPDIDFKEMPLDMTASFKSVMDLNNSPCALIRVFLNRENASFSGNIIGDVTYSDNEYYINMTAGSKFIRVTQSKYKPLLIEFSKFGVTALKGKVVYELTIKYDDENLVELSKITGNYAGHDYVDLGLSSGLKWASCNVGALHYWETGDYVAWGEVEAKSCYNESNCLTYNQTKNELKKKKIIDSNGNLEESYDVARHNWGGGWRIPTTNDFLELIDECSWNWSNQNGYNGCIVTGPNGNSIFLPAAGCIGYSDEQEVDGYNEYGHYWTSSTLWYYNGSYHDSSEHAGQISFGVMKQNSVGAFKYEGVAIRPVIDLTNTEIGNK